MSYNSKSYTQASNSVNNGREVLKIKDVFPQLSTNKIENIQRIIKDNGKSKPKLTMTMENPFRKQDIIPMNNDHKNFIEDSTNHITNLNRALKNIKSDILVNFIHQEQSGVTIITNKVAFILDLQTIEKYIKSTNHIEVDGVEVLRLSQSKSYFKIIGIPYLGGKTSTPITLDTVEDIIKKNHIFNNITLASKLHIIKVSPKMDMDIIWIDIWDVQSSNNAKGLVNRCFNIGSYIATIRSMNMNPGVL